MSETDRTKIQHTIEDLLAEWDEPPRSINEGECMEFVNQLFFQDTVSEVSFERMETDDLPSQYVDHEAGFKTEPYHMWITDGTHHYDAECPEGVSDWKQLPFFRRKLGL